MLTSMLAAIPVPLLAGWLLAINVGTAAAYAWDKAAARRGGRRVRERTLLLLNVAGGVVGAWVVFLGMRHKTLHRRFWVAQSAASVAWALIVVGAIVA